MKALVGFAILWTVTSVWAASDDCTIALGKPLTQAEIEKIIIKNTFSRKPATGFVRSYVRDGKVVAKLISPGYVQLVELDSAADHDFVEAFQKALAEKRPRATIYSIKPTEISISDGFPPLTKEDTRIFTVSSGMRGVTTTKEMFESILLYHAILLKLLNKPIVVNDTVYRPASERKF